jgi:arginine deiminase
MMEATEGIAAPATAWGVDSEYGRLRDVLLCRPEHYRWIPRSPAEEAAMERLGPFDPGLAALQHAELVATLTEAAVACHFLEPDPALPYQVFTRDSSSMTPWGAVVAQIKLASRRGEYAAVIGFCLAAGIPIWRMPTAGCLEGADLMVVRPGLALVGYSGARSEEAAAVQMAVWIEREGWEAVLVPFPAEFIHLDALVCMAAERAAAVSEAAPPTVVRLLESRGIEIVPVSYRDTVALGCNVVALGDDRVVSTTENRDLNGRLRALGRAVHEVEYTMFTTHSGGLHCSTMPLRRDPA